MRGQGQPPTSHLQGRPTASALNSRLSAQSPGQRGRGLLTACHPFHSSRNLCSANLHSQLPPRQVCWLPKPTEPTKSRQVAVVGTLSKQCSPG